MVVIQPRPDRTTFNVTRLHFDGPQRTDIRVASGAMSLSEGLLNRISAPVLMRLIADSMDNPPQGAASPSGDHRGEPTLDLDFTP
jgi:hypothetical protein